MPPVNDDVINAIELTGLSVSGTNVGSTSEDANEVLTYFAGNPSVWYTCTNSTSDHVRLDCSNLVPVGFTPEIDAWGPFPIGTVTSFADISTGGSFDNNPDFMGDTTQWKTTLSVLIPPGEVLYLLVNSWLWIPTDQGTFTFDWNLTTLGITDLVRTDSGSMAYYEGDQQFPVQINGEQQYWLWVSQPTGTPYVDFDVRVLPDPPDNDPIADAKNAAFNTGRSAIYLTNETTAYATAQVGEPNHGGSPAKHSVWYEFFPVSGVDYDIWIEPHAGTPPGDIYKLSVYSWVGTIGALGVSLGEASGTAASNPLVTAQSSGAGLIIAVDDANDPGGTFQLRAEIASPPAPAPPANDDYASAIALPSVAVGSFSGTTLGSTIQPPNYDYDTLGGNVWYSYTPALTGDITLSWVTANSMRVRVWTTYLGGPIAVIGSATGTSGTLILGLTIGTTYLISVETADNLQQAFTINTTEVAAPPANDPFEVPIDVTGAGTITGTLAGGSQQASEPVDAAYAAVGIRSLWYKVTPPHDCMARFTWTVSNSDQVDVWTGTTIGDISIVPGSGFPGAYSVRLRKDETYWVRHWNPKNLPPATSTITTRYEYEIDDPYEDLTTYSWTAAGGTFAVTPFLAATGSAPDQTWVSIDVKLSGGEVLGRFGGANNKIVFLKMANASGSDYLEASIVGDLNGNFSLDCRRPTFNNGFSPFLGPNDEENNGWVRLEFAFFATNAGWMYINGENVNTSGGLLIKTVTVGPSTWPGGVGPPPDGPDPWVLETKNLRITDRRLSGPAGMPGDNIVAFDSLVTPTKSNVTPTWFDADATPASNNDISLYMETNPDASRSWPSIRLSNLGGAFCYSREDGSKTWYGYWVRFTRFPSNTASSWLVISRMWYYDGSGGGVYYGIYGYRSMGQILVDTNGNAWVTPYGIYGTQAPPSLTGIDHTYNVGRLELDEWYYIEVETDSTVGWDTTCKVAINGVQCAGSYSSRLLRDKGDAVMNALRYSDRSRSYRGGAPSNAYAAVNVGACWGDVTRFVSGSGVNSLANTNYGTPYSTGAADVHFGSIAAARISPFPLGAHAAFTVDAAASDGTHDVPDIPSEYFEVSDLRWFGGDEENMNTDMSVGGTPPSGFSGGWLDAGDIPGRIADATGPPGHEAEDALLLTATDGKTLMGPIAYDEVTPAFGWNSSGQYPDVFSGGDPLDDGTNVQTIFAWVRYTGGTSATFTMDEVHTGFLGPFPTTYYADSPTYTLTDNAWHYVYLGTLPYYNVLPTGPATQGGILHYGIPPGDAIHVKQVRAFTNAQVYPRFARTSDNGASHSYVWGPSDAVASSIGSNPNAVSTTGLFMNNTEATNRWSMQDSRISWLLGDYPSGMIPGWYLTRRYIEVLPGAFPVDADPAEDVSAVQLIMRASGYTGGTITTARSAGSIKPRLANGDGYTRNMGDITLTSSDAVKYSKMLIASGGLTEWSEGEFNSSRLRFGFNRLGERSYHSIGAMLGQSAVLKAASWDVLAATAPGPPPACAFIPQIYRRIPYR